MKLDINPHISSKMVEYFVSKPIIKLRETLTEKDFLEKMANDIKISPKAELENIMMIAWVNLVLEYIGRDGFGAGAIYEVFEARARDYILGLFETGQVNDNEQALFRHIFGDEFFTENGETGWTCDDCQTNLDESQIAYSMSIIGGAYCSKCLMEQVV